MIAALLSAALLVGGCDGTPGPVKSTPLFATEEEAFAAAEATYRAYVDLVNRRRDRSDSVPSPTTLLTGEALEADLQAQKKLSDAGLKIVGDTAVDRFDGISSDATSVSAFVCIDATDTRVRDKNGNDVTPTNRELRSTLRVRFVLADDAFLIVRSEPGGQSLC